jgi:predicted Na+-dependent transporter
VATFWHAITGSLLATHWRLRGFPTGEDPHATVRELRRCAENRHLQGSDDAK